MIHKGKKAEQLALEITCQLRSSNLMIELDYSGSSFSKQFKRADKSRAKWALVIGEDEAIKGQLLMKKLRDKQNDEERKEYIFSILNLRFPTPGLLTYYQSFFEMKILFPK